MTFVLDVFCTSAVILLIWIVVKDASKYERSNHLNQIIALSALTVMFIVIILFLHARYMAMSFSFLIISLAAFGLSPLDSRREVRFTINALSAATFLCAALSLILFINEYQTAREKEYRDRVSQMYSIVT